jgi:hypothetical protein
MPRTRPSPEWTPTLIQLAIAWAAAIAAFFSLAIRSNLPDEYVVLVATALGTAAVIRRDRASLPKDVADSVWERFSTEDTVSMPLPAVRIVGVVPREELDGYARGYADGLARRPASPRLTPINGGRSDGAAAT